MWFCFASYLCLPKIHELNLSLRPIVLFMGWSVTYELSKFLENVLSQLVGNWQLCVYCKNSIEFIKMIEHVCVIIHTNRKCLLMLWVYSLHYHLKQLELLCLIDSVTTAHWKIVQLFLLLSYRGPRSLFKPILVYIRQYDLQTSFWHSHWFTFISNNCSHGNGGFRAKSPEYFFVIQWFVDRTVVPMVCRSWSNGLFPMIHTLHQYGSLTLMTFTQSWNGAYRVLPQYLSAINSSI